MTPTRWQCRDQRIATPPLSPAILPGSARGTGKNQNAMREKKLKLLVDNLTHVLQHGLAVQFTDEALSKWVQSLKKDGKTKWEAGQSWLKLHTVGRMTFAEMYSSVGSRTTRYAHYYDEAAGLKFSLQESGGSCAHDTVRAVCLGGGLPYVWRIAKEVTGSKSHVGGAQDDLRNWLKANAWTLAGENGMRAKALEVKRLERANVISAINGRVEIGGRDIERFNARDFDGEIASLKSQCKSSLGIFSKNISAYEGLVKTLQDLPPEHNQTVPGAYELGLSNGNARYDRESGAYIYDLEMSGTTPSSSHPVITPNYTATRDGDRIVLSSGIACDVTATQALEWLAGESGPPRTRYGACSIIEASDSSGQPVKIVRCGCHKLDLRNLGEDFAALLVPTHKVEFIPGLPKLVWKGQKEECMARIRANADRLIERANDGKRGALADFFAKKKSLIEMRDNKEAHLAAMNATLEEARKLLSEKEAEVDPALNLSGSLANINVAMIAACNALVGVRA